MHGPIVSCGGVSCAFFVRHECQESYGSGRQKYRDIQAGADAACYPGSWS